MLDVRGVAAMNEKKAKELRRIDAAHNRYIGVMLAVGLPPRFSQRTIVGDVNWYDRDYRERVVKFYIESFASTPRPNDKTVKKFVRGYMRWLQREQNARAEKWTQQESHSV